ncbi:uncharacterized protein LOC144756139 [Lissotriton helveticus]
MDPADQLKQEVSCPICLEYFREPVLTDCGHNFCRACISRTWGGLAMGPCPQCRTQSQSTPMRPNRSLQRIVELVQQLHRNREKRAAPGKCPAHQEQLSLFCMEDHRALCVLCTMNFDHLNHCVQPLEVAMRVTQVSEFSLFSGSSSPTHEVVSCESCLCPVADPITPACSHSFCRACVARSWSCPTCKPMPKATLWSPAVVVGQLRELDDITNAEPDPEELEPHWSIHGPTCHDEARHTCIHVTYTEEVFNPTLNFRFKTEAPASLQKLKKIVRAERAIMLSKYRGLRALLHEHKSSNLIRLDAIHHSIVTKQKAALLDQHDYLSSIFKSFRLSKSIGMKHPWAEPVFNVDPLKEYMERTEQNKKNSRSAAGCPQFERCQHGRTDATSHQAISGPTLSTSTNKKKLASCRVGEKVSSFSSDIVVGAEGQTLYGGSMKGGTTLWKKSTFSSKPWLSQELYCSCVCPSKSSMEG